MQRMDLTQKELKAFHRALRSTHTRRIKVSILNLNGETITTLNERILDGQVTGDLSAEVTRSLTMSILDPNHSLNFDTDSPDDGALYMDRMVRVLYSVRVEELGRYVSIPVFTGPITRLDRKGDVIDIEAQGKESLALGAIWRPLTIKKGRRKTSAIREIMRERAGETKFAIPNLRAKMPKTVSLSRYARPWKRARAIARSMDKQLFYPGTGRLTLRSWPRRVAWTFRTGNGGDVISDVAVTHTTEDLKNTIVVLGRKPKTPSQLSVPEGSESENPPPITTLPPIPTPPRPRAVAIADPQHPLSPKRLGRRIKNGDGPDPDKIVERHLVEVIEDDSIRSNKEAKKRARRVLDDRLEAAVEVAFDALPIPHLDLGDKCRVVTDDGTFTFRLKRFTLPLGPGESGMSVGYHKNTEVKKRRIRR